MSLIAPEELEELFRLAKAATPGPWWWNSYAAIHACVPKDHSLNEALDDEPGIATVATIPKAASETHLGDSRFNPDSVANALFIAYANPERIGRLASAYAAALGRIKILENPSDGRCMEIGALRERVRELEEHLEMHHNFPKAMCSKITPNALDNDGNPIRVSFGGGE